MLNPAKPLPVCPVPAGSVSASPFLSSLPSTALSDRRGQRLLLLLAGAAVLAALTLLLPQIGASETSRAARITAYALVFLPVALLLHGLVSAAEGRATRRLLVLGAVSAATGASLSLVARPETLAGATGVMLLLALVLANLLRILAAACVGISLGRYVRSAGVALLIAAVATASDLFSVFAGPTKALVEEDSPALDVLLLVFPTFGSVLGFGLGVSDFIFLSLFAAVSRYLDFRYAVTLLCVCLAAFLAVTAGLLLGRPLPALPFIAVAFVLVNADLILASLARRS